MEVQDDRVRTHIFHLAVNGPASVACDIYAVKHTLLAVGTKYDDGAAAMSIGLKVAPDPQPDLGNLWQDAQNVALLQALTTGAVRYLARASEHIMTDDLSSTLHLISRALESDETIDKLTDDLHDMMKQKRGDL